MADRTHKAMSEKVKQMSRKELIASLMASAEQLGEAHSQIRKKDKLIADFTSQKSKAKADAEKLIDEAKAKARDVKEKASEAQRKAERRVEEANAEVARKLANANAEADSIVQTRLRQAQDDIEKMERRREDAKRKTLALNSNVIERYDKIIAECETQISNFRDMQVSLENMNVAIESEDFKKFNVEDYVAAPEKGDMPVAKSEDKAPFNILDYIDVEEDDEEKVDIVETETIPEPEFDSVDKAVSETIEEDASDDLFEEEDDIFAEVESLEGHKPIIDIDENDMTLEDDDLSIMSESLDDYETEEEEPRGVVPDEDDVESQTPLVSEEDLAFLEGEDFAYDFGDGDDLLDDTYSNGQSKSFTDTFMAVKPTTGDDDLSDLDIDAILDGDVLDMDDFEDEQPKINIPPRRRRTGNPAAWFS